MRYRYPMPNLRILALSDLRVQPLDRVAAFIRQVAPDLLLYAGDDTVRLAPVPIDAIASAVIQTIDDYSASVGLAEGRVFKTRTLSGVGRAVEHRDSTGEHRFSMDFGIGLHASATLLPSQRRVGDESAPNPERNPHFARPTCVRTDQNGRTWWISLTHEACTSVAFTEVLQSIPHGCGAVIGNDCPGFARAVLSLPGFHDLHRTPLLLDDIAFLGLEGAPVDPGIGYTLYDEDEAKKQLQHQLCAVGSRPCILVSHAPPRGILDVARRFGIDEIGSKVVREYVDQGTFVGVICGHVHGWGGRAHIEGSTLVVNVASHDNPYANLKYAILAWDGATLRVEDIGAHLLGGPVTELVGVAAVTAKRLEELELDTIEKVAAADPRLLKLGFGPKRATRLQRQAQAQFEDRPIRIPGQAPIPPRMVYLDVETSLQQNDPWLVMVVGPDGEKEQFVELNPQRHAAHLDRVGEWISRYPGIPVASWTLFDRGAMARAYKRLGKAEPTWLDPDFWWSAPVEIGKRWALPLPNRKLKVMSAWLGFKAREPELDGMTVGSWYGAWVNSERSFDVNRVKRYNEDDVLAMIHVLTRLREWEKDETIDGG